VILDQNPQAYLERDEWWLDDDPKS
jgi:hypothetical protein